jgi:pyruvate dehydrogenase E1 component
MYDRILVPTDGSAGTRRAVDHAIDLAAATERALADAEGVFVAASDYMKMLPDALARHLPKPMVSLGTDGFGRSEAREELRDFFEVDARHITMTVLHELAKAGEIDMDVVTEAMERFDISADKPNPYVD